MMQRIEISNTSNTPNFIGSWILKDKDMCDELTYMLCVLEASWKYKQG